MKFFFIVKPPVKKEYQREFLKFKNAFDREVEEEFTEKQGPKNARNLAKRATEQGFEKIIFVGGDGLLNEGVNGIMEATGGEIPQNFAIGTIPTGSGNNFAKALGIPKDVKEAFEIIKNEKTTLVDIGKVNPHNQNSGAGANDRYFVNCFSVGFDALVNKVANDLKTKHRFLPKDLSYLLAALGQIIIKIPNFNIRIEGDKIDYKNKVILVAITNGPTYGAIFKVNPGAIVDDGKFNICIIEPVGKIRALLDLYRATQGTHINLSEVKMLKFSSSLTISSTGPHEIASSASSISQGRPLPYEIDGEVPEPQKEYKISVLPKALRILVP